MPSDTARRRQARSARRLLLIFAATILTPGEILAGFGLRALTSERQFAAGEAATPFSRGQSLKVGPYCFWRGPVGVRVSCLVRIMMSMAIREPRPHRC